MSIFLRFNLLVLIIFVIALIFGEIKILLDMRDKVRAEIQMTANLMDYLVESRLSGLQWQGIAEGKAPTERQLRSLFELHKLRNMHHLDIEFISPSGLILDSNRQVQQTLPIIIPDWLLHFLAQYLAQPPIINPIAIAGQPLGNIVISANINSELIEIWTESNRTLFPLFLGFFAVSVLITLLAAMIFRPADRMLLKHREAGGQAGSPVKRPALQFKRLFKVNEEFEAVTAQLDNHDQQLVRLNQKMVQLQEQERKHLSAELHDEIGQHLSALRFDIASLKQVDKLSDVKTIAQNIDKASLKMLDVVRMILQRLRPPSLDAVGLVGSLQELTSEWQLRYQQHDLQFQMLGACYATEEPLTQLTIYRIIQECLTNISRHAGDKLTVDILLSCHKTDITISVRDNGQGFDPKQVKLGNGLTGMRERVESLQGKMMLFSEPNNGTRLEFYFPLPKEPLYEQN